MSINTKKWFGRIVMLALACLMFLGLKDRVAAKADDPEASAQIIYTKEIESVDGEGNPFTYMGYSFGGGEGWEPYAVYVTPASGSAITLDADALGIQSSNIKIWDNDCAIAFIPEPDGYLNIENLILTGDNSHIDIGWSIFHRGGCGANVDTSIYSGPDTAADIAAYFNGFVFFDDEHPENEYHNDEDVIIPFDEGMKITNSSDPHYNKTVYSITWNMSPTNLILDDNVVIFIQGGGFITVSGSITLGSGSYIESIDSSPRLEITNPIANISGMTLYDNYGDLGQETVTSGSFNDRYFMKVGAPTPIWTKYHVAIPANADADKGVIAAAKKYIYAYGYMDYDGDDDVDGDDLRFALATELTYKFVGSYGMFGLSGGYGAGDDYVWAKHFADTEIFCNGIDINFNDYETIIAKTIDQGNGNGEGTRNIKRYTANITWGKTTGGEEVTGTVYVYELNNPEEILICTDFNEATGTGSTFYVRQRFDDKRVIVGEINNNPSNPVAVDEDYFASVIVTDSISNVAVGSHCDEVYVKNIDTNLYTFQTLDFRMRFKEGGQWKTCETGTTVKIFGRSGKFFATASEGEEKRYDFVSHDATDNAADKIWEAGGQYPVKLFIHDNILHIKPLNANSGVARALKEVRLTDSIPAAAVTINNDNTADIVITFNSNFYDTVHFELVYDDAMNSTAAFTVEREGIIIQYSNVWDPGKNGRFWLDIYGEGDGNEFTYTYDITKETFFVMATYYHSSDETGIDDLNLIVTYDDGSTEVFSSTDQTHNFTGYKSGIGYVVDGKTAADTTTFIITGNMEGGIFSRNGHIGGISAQVVKAGYNAAGSFGGALAGSGKGKNWNGHATNIPQS